jgi:Flp pilus assembly protein TadD
MRNAAILSGLLLAILPLRAVAQDAPEPDHEQQCRANLRTLGEGIRMYLVLHRGKLPKKLGELHAEGLVTELSTFVCPASGKTILSADQIDEKTDYEATSKLAKPPVRLFREKFGHHGGKGLTFYSNRTFKLIAAPEPPKPVEPATPPDSDTAAAAADDAEHPDPPSRPATTVRRDRPPALPPVSALPDIPEIGAPPELPQYGGHSSTPTVAHRPPTTSTGLPRPTQPASAANQARAEQLTKQGEKLWRGNQFTQAAQLFHQAIALAPNHVPAHNGLGVSLGRQQDWAGAEVAFRAASTLQPNSYTHAGHVAIALLMQNKDFPEAERFIRRAIGLGPKHADLHYQHGAILRCQKRWAESESAYRRAIKLDPKKAKYHADMIWALVAQGKTAEARQAAARAKELGLSNHAAYAKVQPGNGQVATPPPPLPPERRTLGPDLTPFSRLLWSSQYDLAMREIRRLSARHPNHAQTNVALGLMELVHQQPKTATKIAERLLKQYPDHVNVLVLRGQAAYWSRDAVKARQMFVRAMKVNPGTASIYFQQGTEFHKRKVWLMAYYQFVTVTQLGGAGAADAQFWLGSTCEGLGDAKQAITWYQAYVRTNPKSPWAAKARTEIQRLRSANR